jgi:hypothetical protein
MLMGLFDLNRTYPACWSLGDLTPHPAAHGFEVVDEDLDQVTTFLSDPDLRSQLDEREIWARYSTTFVEVEPHGHTVPVQRKAGDGWRSVTTPVEFNGGRVWVHVLDLVGPALRGERIPICRAFRVVPRGTAPGLQRVRLPSGRLVDLSDDD